jgi:Ferritin-like domain
MSEALNLAYEGVDREWSDESASTRRRFVQGAAATLGGLGVFGLLSNDEAQAQMAGNDAQTILNVAATAEVLATIVNTVGPEKLRRQLDPVTRRNIRAAARQELIHYNVLKSIGAKELTKRIWVPDAAFASRKGLLTTLEAGDTIFVNAYLIGTTAFANAGKGTEARYTGEFMGVEAVHRALARQSLGKLGNDLVFMPYEFTDIMDAVKALQSAGFGFGARGSKKGRFYDFDDVKRRTPNPGAVKNRKPA